MARPELSLVVDCSASLVAAADAAEEEEEARTTCRLILLLFADDSFHTRTTVFALLVKDALVEEDFMAREDVDEDCVVVVVNPPPPPDAKTRCTSVNLPPPRKQRCDNIVVYYAYPKSFLLSSSSSVFCVRFQFTKSRARECVVRGRGSALRVRCLCACVVLLDDSRERKSDDCVASMWINFRRAGKKRRFLESLRREESVKRKQRPCGNLVAHEEAREIYMN